MSGLGPTWPGSAATSSRRQRCPPGRSDRQVRSDSRTPDAPSRRWNRPEPTVARVRACGGTGIGPAPGGTSKEEAPVPTKLSDAERQARREADRAKAAAAVEALTTSKGWQAWLGLRRHFRTYSANNQFLIALQCEDATYVAGFRKWLQLGYAVRRGETAIRIWMPMPPTRKALAEWEAAGAGTKDRPKMRFRLGPVFARSQVDRLPEPPEPVNLDPPI